MDMMEAIVARHSVRQYTDEPIGEADRAALQAAVDAENAAGGLHMQLVYNDPEGFDSRLAHYGNFRNVCNYLVVAGPDAPDLAQRGGYHGERVVLRAQQLGLNSCWVALTFKKRHVKKLLASGDKLVLVVALGHGATQGKPRKSKEMGQVSIARDPMPRWYIRGLEAALLAPTAVNQQSFSFALLDEERDGLPLVQLKSNGGHYSDVDLGIVRLHFEIGAGADNFAWA